MVNYKINLNNKIIMLYDKCYNQDHDDCFKVDNINVKGIKLNDIKISIDKWKMICIELLNQVKSNKFQFISSTENTSIFKVYLDKFSVSLKISSYNDKDDITNIKSSYNNDNLFLYLLSPLTLMGITKHIELPILNFDVYDKDIKNLFDLYPSLKKLKNNNVSNIFSFRIREMFFDSMTLKKYMKDSKCNIKVLLFQVIHTLAVIQNKYPNFCHNELNLDNFFLYLKAENGLNNNYIFKDKKFVVPCNFDIKICNFEKASLNSKKNKYFDLHYFLGNMLDILGILSDTCPQLLDFMNRVIPVEFRTEDKYLKNNVELLTPAKLLNDKYFKEFLKEPKKEKKEFSKFMGIKTRISNIKHLGAQNFFGEKKSNSKVKSMYTRKIKKSKKSSNKNKKLGRTFKYEGSRKTFSYKSNNREAKSIEQKGGYTALKPPYKKEKNMPISHQEKKIEKRRSFEKPRKPRYETPQVLAEQKIYDIPQKPQKQHPPTFPPTHIPVPNPYYPLMDHGPYSYQPNKIPIQKFYNISLANPSGDHTVLHRIFEDMLPEDENKSFNTIASRLQNMSHMRNTMLTERDGEDMTVTGGEENSLLSYVRLVDINPFSMDVNPYYDMSSDMLLYGAAYPVRYDRDTDAIKIAKDSVGLNIRIYKLTLGAIRSNDVSNQINFDKFDVWRDIYYYEYIRENILKKKLSPNFVMLLLYTKDKKSNIDWDKLKMIKKEGIGGNYYNIEQSSMNENIVNDFHNLLRNKTYLENFLERNPGHIEDEEQEEKIKQDWIIYNAKLGQDESSRPPLTLDEYKQRRRYNNENRKLDLTKQSSESLVAVTEGPTTNLLRWASPIYEAFGSVKKMISTGCHADDVWRSVLFQLVHSFIVLQENGIIYVSHIFFWIII